eukprot:g4982.t1
MVAGTEPDHGSRIAAGVWRGFGWQNNGTYRLLDGSVVFEAHLAGANCEASIRHETWICIPVGHALQIAGEGGSTSVIDGRDSVRIFHVKRAATLQLRDLTVTGGHAGYHGGGLAIVGERGDGADSSAAPVLQDWSMIQLSGVRIQNHFARSAPGGGALLLRPNSRAEVHGSTFENCSAGTTEGIAARGGAISLLWPAFAEVVGTKFINVVSQGQGNCLYAMPSFNDEVSGVGSVVSFLDCDFRDRGMLNSPAVYTSTETTTILRDNMYNPNERVFSRGILQTCGDGPICGAQLFAGGLHVRAAIEGVQEAIACQQVASALWKAQRHVRRAKEDTGPPWARQRASFVSVVAISRTTTTVRSAQSAQKGSTWMRKLPSINANRALEDSFKGQSKVIDARAAHEAFISEILRRFNVTRAFEDFTRMSSVVRQYGCDMCDPGKFSLQFSGKSSSSCEACQAGMYAAHIGSTKCSTCPRGWSSLSLALECSEIRRLTWWDATAMIGLVLGIGLCAGMALHWRSKQRAKNRLQELESVLLSDADHERKELMEGWRIHSRELKYENYIAAGTFGEVWQGSWNGITVAIKRVYPANAAASGANGSMLRDIEVAAMQRLRHPRVVTFFGAGEHGAEDGELFGHPPARHARAKTRKSTASGIFLVTEFLRGGDLNQILHEFRLKPNQLSWEQRLAYARDIAEGMSFLHSRGYVHRDLKSHNILCDGSGRCKIGDFGHIKQYSEALRKSLSFSSWNNTGSDDGDEDLDSSSYSIGDSVSSDLTMTSRVGTVPWMAPELIIGSEERNREDGTRRPVSHYSPAIDVYSYGIILWELLTCRKPFTKKKWKRADLVWQAVLRGVRPEFSDIERQNAPEDFCELMTSCWCDDASSRPTFENLVIDLSAISGD